MFFRRHRYPARFPVTVVTDAGEMRSQISNVNETGAKLSGLTGLTRGCSLTLLLSIGRVRAVVQWVTKTEIGIAFQPQIPLYFVDAIRHGASSATGGKSKTALGHGFRELR